MNFYPLRRWFVLNEGRTLLGFPGSDRCCACDLTVDRYVLHCVQILFFGDHHVENTVFDTQFLKACFAMGLPGAISFRATSKSLWILEIPQTRNA